MKTALFFIVVIFIIDLIVPLGVAIGVLYVVALIFVADKGNKIIFRFAFLCTGLAALKFLYFHTKDTTWMVYANRIISILSIWVVAVLSSRLSLYEEIAKSSRVIQNKNKDIESFIFTASHDLNEPIKNIENLLILMREDFINKTEERTEIYMGLMMELINKMKSINQFLLEFSRIGKYGKIEEVDFNELMQEVLQKLHLLIVESKASIRFVNLPKILGYKNEIKTLFINLISNSIQYRKENIDPIIMIDTKKKGNYWVFNVSDNGIGIREKDKEKVLKIFRRSAKYKHSSLGVGLAVCAKIVDLHQGEIWIESKEGEGTSVVFTLKDNINGKNRKA
jgi:light-regulated signal transduction histidine kinase (bacteriophytochrome)